MSALGCYSALPNKRSLKTKRDDTIVPSGRTKELASGVCAAERRFELIRCLSI